MQKNLAKKKERKSQLTSHLAAIITSHETRKSNRLNELLGSVNHEKAEREAGYASYSKE